MQNEESLRRAEFRHGPSVLLADGQQWALPMPVVPDRPHGGPTIDGSTAAIVRAIREAEDGDERLRAELALGIHLLSENYRLGPDQYRELLCFDPSSPTLALVQEAFHRLAMAYRHQLEAEPTSEADVAQACRGGLFHRLGHTLDWLMGRQPVSNPVNTIGGHSH